MFYLLCAAAGSIALAQRPSSPTESLAVDEVSLATGKRMYGIVMQGDAATGVTLVVERDWFESTYPTLYAEHRRAELEAARAVPVIQLKRLQEWKSQRANDKDLVQFIDEEIARTLEQQKMLEKSGPAVLKPFTLVSYSPAEIKELFVQPEIHHRIAGCAWKHHLKRVPTRTATALKRELEKQNVDPEHETIDLSSQLPDQHAQSEEEWNARVALFEFILRKSLVFQGMGANLLRIDSEKPPAIEDLITQMLGGGLMPGLTKAGTPGLLDGLLKELDLANDSTKGSRPKYDGWEPATKLAESEGIRGLRITRVIQDLASPMAQVEDCFVAQVAPGKWRQIINVSASIDRNRVDPAAMANIKADPQVKKVLDVFNGLGVSSGELIEIAIRQGAATDEARKQSQQNFFEILDRYTQHTDGPPLPVK